MELSDLKEAMKGVVIVQTTPFNKDGGLDLEGMRANTRWLLERTSGKNFIFTPLGSAGEFYAMSDDECHAVIRMVVEEVNGRHLVFPGVGRGGTLKTIEMAQYAQSVGADGVQVVLPYYHVPEEEGMYQHYKQIAESVNIGIMLYNNPFVSGSWVRPALMAKLAKIPNFIAVKENTPNIVSYYFMQKAVAGDAVVLCGQAEELFPFFAIYGCPGFVSSIANYAPELSYSVYEAAVAKDFIKVHEIVNGMAAFWKLPEIVNVMAPLSSFTAKVAANHGPAAGVSRGAVMNIPVVKAAMDILGLRGGELRLPLIGPNEDEKAELSSILRAMKIL